MTRHGVKIGQPRGTTSFPHYTDAAAHYSGLGGWPTYRSFCTTVAAIFNGPRAYGYQTATLEHLSLGQSSGTRRGMAARMRPAVIQAGPRAAASSPAFPNWRLSPGFTRQRCDGYMT